MSRLFHALRIAYSGAVAGFRFGWRYAIPMERRGIKLGQVSIEDDVREVPGMEGE